MELENILALKKAIDLVEEFVEKNIIRKKKINFNKIREKFSNLKNIKEEEKQVKAYNNILSKLNSIIKGDLLIKTHFIIGGHGGIIINNIGFCEFDSPNYAMDTLLKKMQLAVETKMPYNLEIAISCLEWLSENYPEKITEFLRLFKLGKFEIINPSYSQPYNLIIGPESNIKQLEYGIKSLKKLGLKSNIYYCSESSLHPQIPQILESFNIKYGSLRTRLLGINPTSNSAYINWIGLDNTSIDTVIDQSGVFNGEYWHGTFFKEIPNLLFQAVARPFMNYIVYSNLEDFRNPQPYHEEIWRISKFSEIFGKFLRCSEFFTLIEKNGEYKYQRDEFLLGDYLFIRSELFLNNKNSEIILLSAEVINCILGIWDNNSNDSFFTDLWKKLLLTQAHDCYVVPFIRPGDYSKTQLGKKELESVEFQSSNITISDLSIQIHQEIQKKSRDFINKSLSYLAKELGEEKSSSKKASKKFFVFNPTPYDRRDVISIYSNQNSILKVIESIPGFGYKIFSFTEENMLDTNNKQTYYYNMQILEDLKTIQIEFEKNKVFELKFHTTKDYRLYLKEHYKDKIEDRNIIIGKVENQAFKIEIIQYNEINRLEFYIDSHSLQEIRLTPNLDIKKTFINYPFGVEETKRSKIQTLDFLWLKGSDKGIIYIQKNSQQFNINRETFEIRNFLNGKGKYEIAMSITQEKDSLFSSYYVESFYFKLLGVQIDDKYNFNKKAGTFLKIEPKISVINLWRRNSGSYLRVFNPSNKELNFKFNSKLIRSSLKELDFKYDELSQLESNQCKIGPWKIKTFKF